MSFSPGISVKAQAHPMCSRVMARVFIVSPLELRRSPTMPGIATSPRQTNAKFNVAAADITAWLLPCYIQFRQHLLQVLKLGQIIDGDVRLVRMVLRVVLMISLCRIKSFEGHQLRHNRLGKRFGAVKLVNVCLRNAALIIIRIKNHGTILCAVVRALPVQLSRIVRDGEKKLSATGQKRSGLDRKQCGLTQRVRWRRCSRFHIAPSGLSRLNIR